MADYLNIAGRVRTTASDGVAMEAQEVKDLNQNKSQQDINADVQTELGDRYTKEETYSKEQLNELITTPDVNYVSVVATNATTAVTDLLPATGSSDTLYNVGNWNGTQYDTTVYSIYGWDGTAYVCLAVRSSIGEVYDISANHPDGQGNPTPYTDLAAALGTNGANIPAGIRRGGMSIKFIQGTAQSSDNKYVRYNLLSTSFTTDTTQWAIDDTGVYMENPEFIRVYTDSQDRILWAIKTDGTIYFGAGVPPQVIDYVQAQISALSLDEYEDIVAFLGDLINGETLATLLAAKVDKVEGKSLINADYADTKNTIENPEYLEVTTDSEDRIIEGIRTDGTKEINTLINANAGDVNLDGMEIKVIENPEFLSVELDSEGRILSATRKDGSHYIHNVESETLDAKEDKVEGKSLIDAEVADSMISAENPEYLQIEIDAESKILGGRKIDGKKFETVGFDTPNISVDGATIENIQDPENRIEVKTDSELRIISYRDSNGVLHENVGIETPNVNADKAKINEVNVNSLNLSQNGMTEFQQALIDAGFDPGGKGDRSKATHLEIAEPRCAMINIISDFNLSNLSKAGRSGAQEGVNYDIPTQIEFWDMNGNYFKKWTLMSGQGNSSMAYVKKNMAFDFFNENPNDENFDEDNTFLLKLGGWVAMDSYHLKAFYTEFFRGSATIAYKVADIVEKQRGIYADRPWKKALLGDYTFADSQCTNPQIDDMSLQIDNGARCMPDGFPVIVYQNGEFYGVYSFNIKKHRDNYHMVKNNPLNIHLDGTLTPAAVWKPTNGIQWTEFEVRNPKKLVYAEAHGGSFKYDADVAQANIAGNDDGSTTYDAWDSTAAANGYPINKIVSHNGHYFINAVAGNTTEPVYHAKNNADDNPDFKNKTGANWINCTNTIIVKNAIIALSTRVSAIQALSADADKKTYLETYFDVDNLIDYELCQMFTGDTDGTGKNWQWITYDGSKWYCCEYDKDMAFGNVFHGRYTRPVGNPVTWIGNNADHILGQVILLYASQMKNYGLSLLNNNVVTTEAISNLFTDWINRIGQDNFKKEWKKWPESPCNRDPKIDTEHWQRTDTFTNTVWNASTVFANGAIVMVNATDGGVTTTTVYLSQHGNNVGNNPATDDGTNWKKISYDATVTYDPESSDNLKKYCYDGDSSYQFRFNAKVETTDNSPLTGTYTNNPKTMGYLDNFWRVYEYINTRLERVKTFFES